MSSSASSSVPSNNIVDKMQLQLQNTAALEDGEDSSEDEVSSDDVEVVKLTGNDEEVNTVKCTGLGGCGLDFPCNQPGSDFEYASLCSTCYKKQHNDTTDQKSSNKVDGGKDPDASNASADNVPKSNDDDDDEGADNDHCDDVDKEISSNQSSGLEIGVVLSNVRDNELSRFDFIAGNNELAYVPYINDQDNITKKVRKFWTLDPNPTPLLYGHKHYHAMLNSNSRRGWLGHCRLKSKKLDCEGSGYVLWEIWETRCAKPRISGVVINEKGEPMLLKNLEPWLTKNGLSSDPSEDFDEEWYQG